MRRIKMKYGYRVIDDCTGGLNPGEVTLIGGMTSEGKSTFIDNVILNIARNEKKKPNILWVLPNHPIVTELSGLLVNAEGIPMREWEKLSADKKKEIDEKYQKELSGITIMDIRTEPSIKKIKTVLLKNTSGTDLLIIDGLMSLDDKYKIGDDKEYSEFIMQELKSIAKESNCVVLASVYIKGEVDNPEDFSEEALYEPFDDMKKYSDHVFVIERDIPYGKVGMVKIYMNSEDYDGIAVLEWNYELWRMQDIK
jgi:replicative DNA helicase